MDEGGCCLFIATPFYTSLFGVKRLRRLRIMRSAEHFASAGIQPCYDSRIVNQRAKLHHPSLGSLITRIQVDIDSATHPVRCQNLVIILSSFKLSKLVTISELWLGRWCSTTALQYLHFGTSTLGPASTLLMQRNRLTYLSSQLSMPIIAADPPLGRETVVRTSATAQYTQDRKAIKVCHTRLRRRAGKEYLLTASLEIRLERPSGSWDRVMSLKALAKRLHSSTPTRHIYACTL